jgi:hypothetical protein
MSKAYLDFLGPLYVDSLSEAAHALAQPSLCFGIPCVYFLTTMVGYGIMRFVDFYVPGGKVNALKGKKMEPAIILKVIDGGSKFEVSFKGKDTAVVPKECVSAIGFAPPDWFKSVYNLTQV